jgi:hypothetical protein
MLNKETLEKAIAKGLNKAHGKTVVEQTAAVMSMIEAFEEVLGDIPAPAANDNQESSVLGATFRGGVLVGLGETHQNEPKDAEMPSRIGQSAKIEGPIDGHNYRSSKNIQDALEVLPKLITFPVGAKNLNAHRMIGSGIAVGKAECVELQYALEGLNHRSEGNASPRCKFWTTDAEFNPEKKLNELKVAMASYIKTLTRDTPVVAAQLAPIMRPTDFSDAQETENFAAGSFNPQVFDNWK